MERTLKDVHEDPVFQALNPEGKRFITARYLPPSLNPFAKYGIKVAALTLSFPHLKTVPAWQMMLDDFGADRYKGMHTIVVPSSGNTAHAVVRLARAFGFKKVKVVLATDVPDSKSGVLRAFGTFVDVMQVADVVGTATEEAKKPGHYYLDQYSHDGNPKAHELYTGPEVVRALGGAPAVIAVAMGSAGTVFGVGSYLHRAHPATRVLGVRPKLGEQVPGARDEKRMAAVVSFPWENLVERVVEVGRNESFEAMRLLWSAVEPQPGPTSAMAYVGLRQHLKDRWDGYELNQISGKTIAFLCPDDGRFYPERVTGELDPDQGTS
jgi:cysteine synthase